MKIFKKNTRTTTDDPRKAVRGLEIFTFGFLVTHLLKRCVRAYDAFVVWYLSFHRLLAWLIVAHLLDILSTWSMLGVAPDRLVELNPLFNTIWEAHGFVLANLVVASWKLFLPCVFGFLTIYTERQLYWKEQGVSWRVKRILVEPLRWAWVYLCLEITFAVVNNVWVALDVWVF